MRIKESSQIFDPQHFVLVHPRGEHGWEYMRYPMNLPTDDQTTTDDDLNVAVDDNGYRQSDGDSSDDNPVGRLGRDIPYHYPFGYDQLDDPYREVGDEEEEVDEGVVDNARQAIDDDLLDEALYRLGEQLEDEWDEEMEEEMQQ
ncbi:hypothetical protein DFQ26_004148 [Actinomortierella ambigua]|nr:hypothetical protein DFQ26_004148 [Actinomortierella ambigua]